MLVFAIAAAATASLGLIALRQPAVGPALERFGLWAGLFMQVAGIFEALRRLIKNPWSTFSIATAAPTVGFTGAAPLSLGSSKRPQQRLQERVDSRSMVDPDRVEELMDIERIVNSYSPEVFLRSPDLDLKIKSELTKFIHHAPSGAFDDIANARDPMARKATALYWKIDDLAEQAVAILQPNPMDPEDVMAMVIAGEDQQ